MSPLLQAGCHVQYIILSDVKDPSRMAPLDQSVRSGSDCAFADESSNKAATLVGVGSRWWPTEQGQGRQLSQTPSYLDYSTLFNASVPCCGTFQYACGSMRRVQRRTILRIVSKVKKTCRSLVRWATVFDVHRLAICNSSDLKPSASVVDKYARMSLSSIALWVRLLEHQIRPHGKLRARFDFLSRM